MKNFKRERSRTFETLLFEAFLRKVKKNFYKLQMYAIEDHIVKNTESSWGKA